MFSGITGMEMLLAPGKITLVHESQEAEKKRGLKLVWNFFGILKQTLNAVINSR